MTRFSVIRGGVAPLQGFERLVRPHYDVLYRVAYRLCGSRQDAEDLVQETCMRAFRRIERAAELDNPRTWLLCILRRLFIDQTRRYDRKYVGALDDEAVGEIASEAPGPAEATESEQIAEVIELGLRRLGSEQRTLLILHDVEGYSLAELETIMELKIGTLKSKLHRARVKLGRWIQADGASIAGAPARRSRT
jgi:RNA polymerase sigma-70 factor (ECF subfamily)